MFCDRRILLMLLCILLLAVPSFSQQEKRLDLDKFMTPEEQKRTGIARLSTSERIALEKWLYKWTTDVVRRVVQRQTETSKSITTTRSYLGVGAGHWVSKTLDGGQYVELEDGSLWEISPLDRINTALWLVTEEITVIESSNPFYRYKLINTDSSDSAEAKLIKTR